MDSPEDQVYAHARGSGVAAIQTFLLLALSGYLAFCAYFLIQHPATPVQREPWCWQIIFPAALAFFARYPTNTLSRAVSYVALAVAIAVSILVFRSLFVVSLEGGMCIPTPPRTLWLIAIAYLVIGPAVAAYVFSEAFRVTAVLQSDAGELRIRHYLWYVVMLTADAFLISALDLKSLVSLSLGRALLWFPLGVIGIQRSGQRILYSKTMHCGIAVVLTAAYANLFHAMYGQALMYRQEFAAASIIMTFIEGSLLVAIAIWARSRRETVTLPDSR